MNDYAVWRDGRGSEVSSLWDQVHPAMMRSKEDQQSTASIPRMNADPRSFPDPLSHLTKAVENIDIRHGMGREPPPHQYPHPLPPIQHLPLPNQTHLPPPPTHHTPSNLPPLTSFPSPTLRHNSSLTSINNLPTNLTTHPTMHPRRPIPNTHPHLHRNRHRDNKTPAHCQPTSLNLRYETASGLQGNPSFCGSFYSTSTMSSTGSRTASHQTSDESIGSQPISVRTPRSKPLPPPNLGSLHYSNATPCSSALLTHMPT